MLKLRDSLDISQPEIPRALWLLTPAVAGLAMLLLVLTKEIVLAIAIASLVGVAMSFSLKLRMYFLVALLPLAHAGFGLSGFRGFGVLDVYLLWFIFLYLCRVVLVEMLNTKIPKPLQFALWMMIFFVPSMASSVALFETLKAFAQLAISILTAASVYDCLKRKQDFEFTIRLIWFLVFTAGVVSVIGLYQTIAEGPLFAATTGRAYFSLFQDVNYYAGYLLMALAVAIGLILIEEKFFRRLLLIGLSLAITISVIATVSRSAMAILLLLVLGYGLYFFFQKGIQKIISLLLIAGFVGLVGVVLFTDVGSKLVNLFTLSRRVETVLAGKDASLQQRQNIASVTLEIIKANPFTGVGFGAFEETFDEYKGGYLSTGSKRSAHNTFLRVFAETGIIGFIPFLIFAGSLILTLAKSLKQIELRKPRVLLLAMLFSLSSFLLMSLTLDQMFEPHFWVMCGIALAFQKFVRSTVLTSESLPA
jgi:O-antigen ligase